MAARKLGVIKADVAVALSLSLTHKSLGFDRQMPQVDLEGPDVAQLPETGTLPLAAQGGAHAGGRHQQRPIDRPRQER